MIFLIGGAVIGAVIGIVGWAVDYNKRKDRYERETAEKVARVGEKLRDVNSLRQTQNELVTKTQENKNTLNDLNIQTNKYKEHNARYRIKLSEIKDHRDDLEQKLNNQNMEESFNSMGF